MNVDKTAEQRNAHKERCINIVFQTESIRLEHEVRLRLRKRVGKFLGDDDQADKYLDRY